MKKPLILLKSGELLRRENTLYFISTDGKRKVIPINAVSEVEVFGELSLNKRVLEFLTRYGIPVHFYNYYGYYVGTYYPREQLNSGYIVLKQAEHRLNEELRLKIAKSFVLGSLLNIVKNLKRYDLVREAEEIGEWIELVEEVPDVPSLMAIEGKGRELYYRCFNSILKSFSFEKRMKRPPKDEINALISFGNSVIYTKVLTEIYATHLDPRIGYLHETNMRSFTLSLDLSEVFKPLIVDRLIFSLINKRVIRKEHFSREAGICYLNQKGKEIFLRALEERLSSTVRHRKLRRNVSYKRLIRLECYKLIKHIIGDETYKPFVIWW